MHLHRFTQPRGRHTSITMILLTTLALTTLVIANCRILSRTYQRQSPNLNIILITIDTLRADHVGAYGKGRASTPVLDSLAAEGALFHHCVAQAPLTLPSHTSLLSSTYPLFNQVRDNGGFQAPESLTLLSETLKQKGLATAAFIGAFVLHGKWGLNQGFDVYSDRFDPARYGKILLQNEKRAEEVLGNAKQWLKNIGKRQFFVWIHLYDPHLPYDPPRPYKPDSPQDAYRGEVEYTDGELGKFISFLKEKGLYDKSVIVAAADHGEGLGDHGEVDHGMFLYETTIHVPFIIRAPRAFKCKTVGETVELVDVAPTVLDLLDIPAPKQWQGRSLWPLLDGRKADDLDGQAYSETHYPRFHYGWSSLQSFTNGRLKYILAPRDELFDLARDPQELRELAGDRRRLDLKKRMLAFISRSSRGALKSASVQRMNADDQRRLASLGYLSGTVKVDESRPLADPKDKIAASRSLAQATQMAAENRLEEAAALLDRLTREEPALADAWNLLGSVNLKRRKHPEALAAFRRALSLKPDSNFFMLDILKTLVTMGDTQMAASEALRFLEVFPGDSALLEKLGYIRLLQRRPDEALTALHQAVTIDPAASQSFNLAGEALMMKKDYAGAEAILRQGLKENAQARNTRYLLACVMEALNRPEEAIELYKQELDVNNEKYQAALNLADLLAQRQQFAEAIHYYRMAIHANPELKAPRFHLAEIMLEENRDLDQAIALCLEGVDLPPRDQDTLFGYFMLTKLYEATGNPERRAYYFNLGAKLSAALGR